MNGWSDRLGLAAIIGSLAAVVVQATPAAAEDRRVRIVNDTKHTMVRFYASNASRASWGEDVLGRYVLRSGRSEVVDIDDGSGACLFDFRAIFDDGEEVVREAIDVCQISEYRFQDD